MGENLADPEIATTELTTEEEAMFVGGNLSKLAIDEFLKKHSCSQFCKCVI